MNSSKKLGNCIIGEHLIGTARKIHSFNNPEPLVSFNKESYKLKRMGQGGKKSECYVNKMIRVINQSDESRIEYKTRVKNKLQEKFPSSVVKIFDVSNDLIKGGRLICECQSGKKSKKFKKVTGFSSTHSAGSYDFKGSFCVAYVDQEFGLTKGYRIIK